jgi:hypothetical protein
MMRHVTRQAVRRNVDADRRAGNIAGIVRTPGRLERYQAGMNGSVIL